MGFPTATARIICHVSVVDTINTHFERAGYGPNNVSVPLIQLDDPDDAAPSAYGAEARVDPGILALTNTATFVDGYWVEIGKPGEHKLDEFAAWLGYRRKPAA